ncbi:BAG family molecular chaperone regulator 1-like [Zingiber officinale]|uniref:BAG family molecular chaperone regulator 1-like n=1 Tax=Zingiber officinale TaxID=94328 RepID=UPI001C4A82CA|nr:BAG family molecular chaperone regulator 1-like [Zingiber officinale]
MRSRTSVRAAGTAAFSPVKEEKVEAEKWEVRPGGMLVQSRSSHDDAVGAPVPAIRVKVKYGAVYHEIYISSRASFGELKKELSARTGLHPLDMKLLYKDKERASATFLDSVGVKDKSKVVLTDDPTAKAKRLLEMRKTDKIDKAAKSVSAISLEVDRLASKVTALEAIANKGERIVVNDVSNLIDCLMNELVKLEAIDADGDVKQQKRQQIKRVQKHVETLDLIKLKNGQARKERQPQCQPPQKLHSPPQAVLHSIQPQYQQQMQQPHNPFLQQNHHQQQPARSQSAFWEPFDLLTPSTSTPTSATTSTASSTPHASFDWKLF